VRRAWRRNGIISPRATCVASRLCSLARSATKRRGGGATAFCIRAVSRASPGAGSAPRVPEDETACGPAGNILYAAGARSRELWNAFYARQQRGGAGIPLLRMQPGALLCGRKTARLRVRSRSRAARWRRTWAASLLPTGHSARGACGITLLPANGRGGALAWRRTVALAAAEKSGAATGCAGALPLRRRTPATFARRLRGPGGPRWFPSLRFRQTWRRAGEDVPRERVDFAQAGWRAYLYRRRYIFCAPSRGIDQAIAAYNACLRHSGGTDSFGGLLPTSPRRAWFVGFVAGGAISAT